MKFRRLKLAGFKSFVEPAELRIEPGLTGIVGPNGCGKSNLLEALRWVMGESSAKSMRGGGMDDVIFAGTATRPARGFAEVQLHAERGEDDSLEVVRRIERGAGSAYRVNGRDVRARDVALVFADAATGAHSPALVSQGRIGAVIAARPTERRAMLEEAAGIAGLHVRRKDAEQKLRATEVNLGRLDEVIADMAARAGQLKRQARQAERYRLLSGDIRIAEARLIYARWRDAAAAAEAAKREAAEAGSAVAQAAEAQRSAAAWSAEATRIVALARAEAQAARDHLTETGHRLATLTAERAALDRRIADLATQIERLAADRAREGSLANDAAEAIDRLGAEVKRLDARIAESEAGRPALADRLATAERAARDSEVGLARALGAQAIEQADIRVARASVVAARTRDDRAGRDADRLARDAEGLGDDAALLTARDAAVAARQAAEDAIRAAVAELDQTEAERAAAADARGTAESTAATARSTLAQFDSEAAMLERTLAQGAAGAPVLALIRAAPGYERALAAALGDDLSAGLDQWQGADRRADDPALPGSAEPLADHVTAPAQLARRLAQVGVVDIDEGDPLAVGQRIVTRAGVSRRWDGFVARDRGAAVAERLIRANRLADVQAALPGARAAVDTADRALATAREALTRAATAIDHARAARATAEQAARTALRDEDQATTAIERLTLRRIEIGQRTARATDERDEAARDLAAALATVAALPDEAVTLALVDRSRGDTDAAREQVSRLKTESATVDRIVAADRERRAAALAETKGWRARAGEAAKRIDDMAKRARSAEADALALADAPALLDARIVATESERGDATVRAAESADAEQAAEGRSRAAEATLAAAGEALALARETRAGAAARAENQDLRRVEMGRVSGERFECPPPLLPERVGFDSRTVGDAAAESGRHERLLADRERIGPVNLIAEQELQTLETEQATGIAQRDELAQAINRLRGSIGSLNREGRARLLAAFEAVNGHFRRLFATLFNGGEAYLELIDSDDPLEAGLEIMAQPPGKKLVTLTLLSGGEQALTAVALIFGLFLTNPAPICVLDEVDAPLDDANIERFCDLLDAMVGETETRYLIVTHNAVTMSRMHRLFGVTMIEPGVSRLVSVDLCAAERLLAAE